MEYNYDWMAWAANAGGVKLFNCTLKEIMNSIKLTPSYAELNKFMGSVGAPAVFMMMLEKEYLENIINAHKEGKKLVLNTFLANQLMLNCFDGLQPICVESMTGFASIGFRNGAGEYMDYCVEKGMTETSCSAQRGIIGAIMAGLTSFGKPDLALVGAAGPCDTNCNAIQFYADYAKIPMITLDTPAELVSDDAAAYELKELERLIEQIEQLTGARLNEDKLRDALNEMKKQNEMINEIFELTRLVPNPISAPMTLIIASILTLNAGHKMFTQLLEAILAEGRKNAAEGRAGTFSGKEKGRIFLFYIDHYTLDARFHTWCMENDYTVVPNIVYTTYPEGANYSKGYEEECYHIDTTDRQSMLKSVAALNSRLAMNKQLRGPVREKTQWLKDTQVMAKLMKADYLMYVGTYGCRNTWSINKILQREMEKLGYPTLLIFCDVFDDRSVTWESIQEQMEEFISVRRKVA
jgi:hypothetical protein